MTRLTRINDILDSWTPDVAREFIKALPDDVSVDMKSPTESLLSIYLISQHFTGDTAVAYKLDYVIYDRVEFVRMPEWYKVWYFIYLLGDSEAGDSEPLLLNKEGLLAMIDWMASRAELREAFMMGESFEEDDGFTN